MNVKVDDSDFQGKMSKFLNAAMGNKVQAVRDVASEVLRLSSREVPHDKGMLQNTGFVEDGAEESIVGYNTPYAARLHEHPEYRFQKGRKGKYLEDPIKNNMQTFKDFILRAMGSGFSPR